MFNRRLTLLRMGGGKKAPPTSFSSVTSGNVGISPKNFLTFSFNPFATLVLKKVCTWCQSRITELKPRPPLQKSGFSGHYNVIRVYDNFFHRNARVTKLWSQDHFYIIT